MRSRDESKWTEPVGLGLRKSRDLAAVQIRYMLGRPAPDMLARRAPGSSGKGKREIPMNIRQWKSLMFRMVFDPDETMGFPGEPRPK